MLEEVVAAFSASDLAGRRIGSVPVPGTDEVGFEVDIQGVEPLVAWRAARPVCVRLGLWPLASEFSFEPFYSRHFFDEVRDGRDQRPAAIIERAESMSWPLADGRPPGGSFAQAVWPEVVRSGREETVRRLGEAPKEEELLARCPKPDDLALQRELLDWEEARRPTEEQEPPGCFDEPVLDLGDRLALLPNPKPWAVPAYFHYWGAGSERSEQVVRTLKEWHDRYEAVPWAATGLTINLHVGRPLDDVRQALQVAAEQEPFCKTDTSLREQARALFGARYWELYDRP